MYTDIVRNVTAVYDHYIKLFNIDPDTGELPSCDKKLATYPYIGSRYGETQKLLVVGLDIGSDEVPGRIQTLEERQQSIEKKDPSKHNPHIAGTYMTALYHLRKSRSEWTEYWDRLDSQKTCQALLKQGYLPSRNPLSCIGLTNYHKFVTVSREHRAGGKDRTFIDKDLESKFLDDEIEALGPDMVVLQGSQFFTPYHETLREIASRYRLFIGPHPSARKNVRNARNLIRRIVPW